MPAVTIETLEASFEDVYVVSEPIEGAAVIGEVDLVVVALDNPVFDVCLPNNPNPIDEPTDGVTSPPKIIPDKPKPFIGEWYIDAQRVNTCGCSEGKTVTDYLEFHVVVSMDLELTRLLRQRKFKALKSPRFSGRYVRKILSARDHLKQDTNEIYASDPGRGYRFAYPYQIKFPNPRKMSHLALIFFPKINMQDFVSDNNLKLSPSLDVVGKVISETVIENYRVHSQTRAYRNSKTGEIWNKGTKRKGTTTNNAGHVHKYIVGANGDGAALEACPPQGICHSHRVVRGVVQEARGATGLHTHSIGNLPVLSAISVLNTKVKNELNIRKAKRLSINLTPEPRSEGIIIKKTNLYMPFFGLSCDPPTRLGDMISGDDGTDIFNTARFYFDLNIEEALRNTEFGGIFDKDLTPCCKERIIELSKILSLEVRRTRISDLDNLSSPVTNDLTQLVAFSHDKADGMYQPAEFIEQIRHVAVETKILGCNERRQKIGFLKEIFMHYKLGIRSFSGTDYYFPETGEYRYCVSVKIRNGITLFLNEKLSELIDMRKKLTKWYARASRKGMVDGHRNRFTKKYKDLSFCNPTGGIQQGDNPYLTITEIAIVTLINILSCITNYEHIPKNDLINILYSITSAESGNLDGVRILVEMYDLAIHQLSNTLGVKLVRMDNTGRVIRNDTLQDTVNYQTSKAMTDVISFEKCIDDIVCPCGRSDTWFDFLGIDVDSIDGVKEVSSDQYLRRMEAERDKYSSLSTSMDVRARGPGTSIIPEGASLTPTGAGGPPGSSLSAITFENYLSAAEVMINGTRYSLRSVASREFYQKLRLLMSSAQRSYGKPIEKPADFDVAAHYVTAGSGITFVDAVEKSLEYAIDARGSELGDTADIFGADDKFVSEDLQQDNGCLAPETLQSILNDLLVDCPNPCGDRIKFVHEGFSADADPTSGFVGHLEARGLGFTPRTTPPPQLVSLMNSPIVESALKTLPELKSLLLFNFDILTIVEALTYVESSRQTVKKFVPLTREIVASAATDPVLCRIKIYLSRRWGMRECPDFYINVCDNLFIMGDTSNKIKYCLDNDNQVKNYLIKQQKVYRNLQTDNVATQEDHYIHNDQQHIRLI